MSHATCALCGAENPLTRVYLGMLNPQPNIIALKCAGCGVTSSQLRSLGDYLTFACGYAVIALLLVIAGRHVAAPETPITWVATIAALVPFGFVPALWALWRADALAAGAPAEDLSVAEKLIYLTIAIAVIAALLGGGLFVYLRWLA